MTNQALLAISLLPFLGASLEPRAAEADASRVPLTRAHSHNDYEHDRPLRDALEQGFCSVEADIYLVDGQLLVAHDRSKVSSERTLGAMYLEPLRELVKRGGGRVYAGGPPVVLLIDIKSEAEPTYQVLREVLQKYADILTRFSKDQIETNAVMAILCSP